MSLTYRVHAYGVHCPGAPGVAQLRVERPVDNEGNYTDSEAKPTTLSASDIERHQRACGDFCHLKLHKLLRDGALVEMPAKHEQLIEKLAAEKPKGGAAKDGA